ncbi:FAST kinase domain-containing protein 1, mitochondrial-like [Littorina saxatilis]|uniref:RAP domain-containing protein n=1 Tax=Littorina saxatilis TaxID=31220 RepID=A0AAN9GNW2_9CAEN
MYRYLMRQPFAQAVTVSVVRSGGRNRTAVDARHYFMGRNSARGKSGISYSQWHFWRKAVSARDHLHPPFQVSTALLTTRSAAETSQAPESVNDVFERYSALLGAGNFRPESFIDFATSLCSAVYTGLSWLPWLHSDNRIIAFMQILMNDRNKDLLREPLYGHKHFQNIYDHIDRNVDHIPKQDCPSILLALLYSGLEKEDHLVIKLLGECYDAASMLNMHQLRDLTHVFQCLGGRDFALAEKIVCRMEEMLHPPTCEFQFEITDLCASNPVIAVYMSKGLLEKCVSAMLYKVQEKSPDLDVVTIGCCFRYARKMAFRVERENLTEIKVLGKAALDTFTNFEQFESYNIAEICHNAKRLGYYSGDVVEKMQKRSWELLRDEKSKVEIGDVTNLLFAFSRDLPSQEKKEIGQLLMKHLDDADVLTLSNIADNMLELGLNDPDLVALFQWKVMQNIDNISQYITRLVKVLRLLRERLEYDTVFNQQMCEILLKLLDRRQGYDPTFVVVVSQFVLPNVRTIVPAVLLECLLNVIPRCSLSLMLLVLNGMQKMKGPWSRSLHNQILEIRTRIQQNAGELIENAVHANQLAQLVKGLHIKSQNRDFLLLDRMMDHYPKLTKTMSRQDYLKTVHIFKRLSHPYYHPEVFEDLITFAKENYPRINFFGVLDLVDVLANAAYRPENFADFSAFAVQVLKDAMEEENYIGQITMANHLTVMQIFPDNALGHIFTFDYLEEVDGIIEDEPDRRTFLKNLMMQLNRSVILECPHLDVPWFHEQYCREKAHVSNRKEFQRNVLFVDDVQSALQEVLRGLKFLGHNVYSPYFHPIDFEIVLDAEGQPVPNSAMRLLNPEEFGYQRVAVMLIANQQLCANSHRRRGQYLRDRRHLEMLGYRVEEICRYDWNSMALSDWGAKVNFVRNKIFPRSKKSGAKEQEAPTIFTSESSAMHPYWR